MKLRKLAIDCMLSSILAQLKLTLVVPHDSPHDVAANVNILRINTELSV